jgi:hypothetical protein
MLAARLLWVVNFMSGFPTAERTLASVAALALFALNEARMFQYLPREPNPAAGQVHSVTLQLMGSVEPVYLSTIDLYARWGFVGLTVALCVWAVAETFERGPQQSEQKKTPPRPTRK